MRERIERLKNNTFDKKHHALRQQPLSDPYALAVAFDAEGLSDMQRAVKRFEWMMGSEIPQLLEDERIAFMRTVPVLPELFTAAHWDEIKKNHAVCELGRVFNVNGDYALLLREGLGGRRANASKRLKQACTEEQAEYLNATIACIDAILGLCKRYEKAAMEKGNEELARILASAPYNGATTFREALQLLRIMQYALWCAGHYHNTIGRFDQYMLPYYKADCEKGVSQEDSFELIEEYFIALNRDSDLYIGMQQGDNGQSMVLGGVDSTGKDAFNDLSRLCLKASLELKLIDPKINLRVNKNTPLEVYMLGTLLTREGLGFPQYTNDDVAIEGLCRLGYDIEDARDYTMAACWELIIPGKAMDVVNIDAICYADVVDQCTRDSLLAATDFEAFLQEVRKEIKRRCALLSAKLANLYLEPAPVQSIIMSDCIEQACDIAKGGKYNNYGIHGTGLSTAADALCAIKQLVFEEKSITAQQLIQALACDFEGFDELRQELLCAPKFGNDDDRVDAIASFLMEQFADGLKGLKNDRGGIFRAGTGSAMFYVIHAETMGATADGRRKGEWFSANYSPSLGVKLKGPVSVIHSFTKPPLVKAINGGPLTLELHDSVFHSEGSIEKVGRLVQLFVLRGGHQLQLNAINREKLLDAQANPQQYRNLIVRVWGWSGYFVELDKIYQDHIIKRIEFNS